MGKLGCKPLIVRLRNWVGDVTLGLPALQRLELAGYSLELVGKRWAAELLAGHRWPVHPLAATTAARVRQLRELRARARGIDPAFDWRLNMVVFPYSFGSALEARLAGLRAIGHAYEGRGALLARSVPRPRARHELEVYWHLASSLIGSDAALPARIGLQVAAEHRRAAAELRQRHGVRAGYVIICPFAGGTFAKQDKTWPEFAAFAADELGRIGRDVLVCPGPGEEELARSAFASCIRLEGVAMGVYAALLADAALMISNDTGPGHVAAAVGTPLLSVLGPSEPDQWRAWGDNVHLVRGDPLWPSRAAVFDTARTLLAA
jgi:heptosyltransferase-2